MSKLTHFNAKGDAHMVDISNKDNSKRIAIVEGFIHLENKTIKLIVQNSNKKGDVLQVARLAAIMAAKKTADIIPLCHPITITHIEVILEILKNSNKIRCQAICETIGKTGIEMEALVACNTALMTIYDMCKSYDRNMIISSIRLLEKSGGKSGNFVFKNCS